MVLRSTLGRAVVVLAVISAMIVTWSMLTPSDADAAAHISSLSAAPPMTPSGGAVLGPFSTRALCERQAVDSKVSALTALWHRCSARSAMWWLVVGPHAGHEIVIGLVASVNATEVVVAGYESPVHSLLDGTLMAVPSSVWWDPHIVPAGPGVTVLRGPDGRLMSSRGVHDDPALLQAVAGPIGATERFVFVPQGGMLVGIRAANGRYVSVQPGTFELRAAASRIGPHELFSMRFSD